MLCVFLVLCEAKVINTDPSSSHSTKVLVGAAQLLQWVLQATMPRLMLTPRPPRKVKIAVVGLRRTASSSFSAALKELGYAPVHDDETTEVSDIIRAMMDGTATMDESNKALGQRGFDAPMISLPEYVKWAATAPDIKVILTLRDKKKWAKSFLAIAPAAFFHKQRPFKWIQTVQDLGAFMHEGLAEVPTKGRPDLINDLPTLEDGYEAWASFVRNTIPADRLLEFDVTQGWGPLCEFLDNSPAPSTPFPHINDRAVVNAIVQTATICTWIWPLLFACPSLLFFRIVRGWLRPRENGAASTGELKTKSA